MENNTKCTDQVLVTCLWQNKNSETPVVIYHRY